MFLSNGVGLETALTLLQEYTSGQLKVLVYHNSNSKVKSLKKKDLMKYDVIMISCMGLYSRVVVQRNSSDS